MKDWLITVLENNPINATALFIIGVLMVIIIQNFFFYFNHKDKAYLWYSLYGFIILLDQTSMLHNSYVYKMNGSGMSNFGSIHHGLEWLYNSAYLIFVLEFGGLHLMKEKKSKKIKYLVFSLAIILIILTIIDFNTGSYLVRLGFLLLLVPVLIILSFIIYYHLFKMKTTMKYYIIPGSLAFSIFSVLALATSLIGTENSFQLAWVFFYIGVFIENIFFSLGLVVKQKLVLKERNESQQELIVQLRENDQLRNSLTEKLQEEVSKKTFEIMTLNEIAETEKIKQLEINFEKEIAEMKVSSLQSQMNPHFIFNSLNSIKLYIIKNDKENAVYYLNKFSKLIRKILSASREKEVSLQEELDTVELYANIENIRFKNSIKFNLYIEDNINLSTIKIPPLILQPFIENAIWHGLSPKKGIKKLQVNVNKKGTDFIEITIIDNGIGRKKSAEIKDKKLHKKESLGLRLTEERLNNFSLKLNNKHQLYFTDLIEDGVAKGTKVTIELPLK
jgi:sensor histidine kinase YesM